MKLEEKLLGRVSRLYVTRFTANGIYLGSYEQPDFSVLLPNNQVPEGVKKGDILSVFIYRDSEDRLIATMEKPYISLGEMARLRVTDVTNIGAFLDWGLAKDLFLPFKEQTHRVKKGEEVLAALYIDKSSRLCATMNVYPYLTTDSPYRKEDRVKGTVYEISRNFGAFVAVDDRYSGLIPQRELYGAVQIGDVIDARVTEVKEDGKLTLSIREKAYLQIEKDAQKVLEIIESFDGAMPFTDKASPEVIRRETQMSKNEFKRAVGHLLKEGLIEITERAIRLK